MIALQYSSRYAQIAAHYRRLIDEHQLAEGDGMPTDEEIGRLFSVSRITVRQAMSELVNAGYIERIQGKGTYVKRRRADMQLNSLQGFTEEMRAKGLQASSVVHHFEIIGADPKVADRLRVEPDSKVFSVVRIRRADGTPMAIEHLRIPFFLCPALAEMDLSASIYSQISERCGIAPARAVQNIEAGLVGPENGALLGLKPNEPALFIERISYLDDGTPLEYVNSVYRGDKYTFHVQMQRV